MGERSDEIEEQINRTRGELDENLSELQEKVKNAFDWRAQFEERPMTFLAVAFGGGVLASAVLPGARRGKRQVVECANVSTRDGASDSAKERVRPAMEGKPGRDHVGLDAFKGALITVAASKIGGALGDFLSTYRNELNRARATRNR